MGLFVKLFRILSLSFFIFSKLKINFFENE